MTDQSTLQLEQNRDRREDEHWRRVRQVEDTIRERLTTLAGIILGFSLLGAFQLHDRDADGVGTLVASWILLGSATFVGAMHAVLMTWLVRDRPADYKWVKRAFNTVALICIGTGLGLLLLFAVLNAPD